MKSGNLLHKWGFVDSQLVTTVTVNSKINLNVDRKFRAIEGNGCQIVENIEKFQFLKLIILCVIIIYPVVTNHSCQYLFGKSMTGNNKINL